MHALQFDGCCLSSSRSFLLGCLGEMLLTLFASGPFRSQVRIPSLLATLSVQLQNLPATCLFAGSELGLASSSLKTHLCRAKSEQLSGSERLVGAQIHTSSIKHAFFSARVSWSLSTWINFLDTGRTLNKHCFVVPKSVRQLTFTLPS